MNRPRGQIAPPGVAYTDRCGTLTALVRILEDMAGLESTTCYTDGCWVLLDEVCPECTRRRTDA